jgi:hypothetical protein
MKWWIAFGVMVIVSYTAQGKVLYLEQSKSVTALTCERAQVQLALEYARLYQMNLWIQSKLAENAFQREQAKIYEDRIVRRVSHESTRDLDEVDAKLIMARMTEVNVFNQRSEEIKTKISELSQKLELYNRLLSDLLIP